MNSRPALPPDRPGGRDRQEGPAQAHHRQRPLRPLHAHGDRRLVYKVCSGSQGWGRYF